jgi:hypothetical protein
MTNAERLARLARAEGMTADPEATDTRLHVNLDYVFDPVLAAPCSGFAGDGRHGR